MTVERGSAGTRLAGAGVVAQAAGFALDAWLHARDPGLAARESVFGLNNPGHVLVAAGLALVILGVGVLCWGARAAPVALLAAVAVAVGATAVPTGAHDHAVDDGLRQARARADRVIPGLVHGHDHAERPPEPLAPATRQVLGDELVEARRAALRYPTVADAEAAGYRMVTPYVPLIGAHYLRIDLTLRPFAVDRPAMVLYDGTRPESRVVGLSYYVEAADEPAGFAGPEDRWHRHVGLCFDDRLVVVGGEGLSAEQCDALGGHIAGGAAGWMLHAWVVPGWESSDGVFSAENRSLL
ncbi:MAG TPA: hypothetical protein VF244_02740 [Acidimicrobiales bacterium]